jgi:signal transduction histidine kinase
VRHLFSSVRVRITMAVTLIFGIAASMAAVGLVRRVESALNNDIQVRNDTVTQALSQLLASGQVSPEAIVSSASQLNRALGGSYDPEVLREGITESSIYVTGPAVDDIAEDSLLARIKRAVTGEPTPLFGRGLPDDVTSDRFAISTARVETPRGSLVLNVASPLGDLQRTVNRISNALLIFVPILVGLVGAMTWFMTGRALRPVSDITKRVQVISGSTLHERVPEPAVDDEIGELARTMNAMLDRLEAAVERQKRFVSDASHELRSPVASIKTQLETALLHPETTDWPAVASTLLAEDSRLELLVDNLLALARLDEGVRRTPVEVDLDEVVFEQTARTFRVPVDRSRVGAGRVVGVPQEFASVVRNLVDNATRHARSQVLVTLATVGPFVRLTVEDDGPGIAVSDRSRVFERFTRLEEGRTRDRGGSGLGLALCRRVVEASGGKIFIETSELGGASFVVELPALED